MRSKLGLCFIFLGVLLLCGSLSLYLNNSEEELTAEQDVQVVMPQIMEMIPTEPAPEVLAERLVPLELREPESFEMREVVIDGYAYIGYLGIPKLGLNLPIMSDWDYPRLKIAPCRYHGSINSEDLVLMAHNFRSHFGRIKELKAGDQVYFTDMDGVTTFYRVVSQDILPPNAVEEMTAGDFDLTLFTCTYGGASRVSVYCDME